MTARPPLAARGLVTVRETVTIRVPRATLWDWFVRAPVEEALPGGGGLPRVTGTEAFEGPDWGVVGAARRVRLSDGTAVTEAVTEAVAPGELAYQVWGFEGFGGRLLDQALGRFAFTEEGKGGTVVAWTYAFAPRAAWARPVVALFARHRFAGFMRAGLSEMRTRAEAAHARAA